MHLSTRKVRVADGVNDVNRALTYYRAASQSYNGECSVGLRVLRIYMGGTFDATKVCMATSSACTTRTVYAKTEVAMTLHVGTR